MSATGKHPWPRVQLGEVLSHRKEFITIDDLTEYMRPRVQLHAQGIVLRDRVPGAEIKTKSQQVCRAGDFLVAEIDAKMGGFGIVPDSLADAIVSSHYFLFEVDESKLDKRFLEYFSRTMAFREQVAAQGTTNYAAIRPSHVLGYQIPLPPLPEQRRIVARLADHADRIAKAQQLAQQVAEESAQLLVAMAHRGDMSEAEKRANGWRLVRLGEVIKLSPDPERVCPDKSYPNLGIFSFGRGLFHKPDISGLNTSANTLFRVRAGQFIYSRLFAFEGSYGMVTTEFDMHYVSNEYPVFDCDPSEILPEFLVAYFKPQFLWKIVAVGSKGLGDRRQRVQPEQILAHSLWLPPLREQLLLAGIHRKLETAKGCQAATAAELDALLPALLDRAFKGEL